MTSTPKKVLIVDDDSRNIFALNLVLRSRGYTCVSAADAETGIEMLERDNGIGVVLMDMMMPGMDGYEAIGRIKADSGMAKVPIIAVTAQAMAGDREKIIEAGATAYVSKPVDVDALVNLLETYLK
jgi:CheY-like chemotaxis protein